MSNQNLLIVDDSEDIHELVHVWLDGEPLEFFSSYTGEEALARAAEIRPDLILLDVDLPGIDGFEVCKRLKASPVTTDIPIVFLTGASSTEEKLNGLESGAVDYVTKPFDPAELRARVRSSLNTRRLMDLLAQKAVILQESEERFRVLAENSSDVICRLTPHGSHLYVSPASTGVLGYAPDALVGHSLLDYVHPEELAAFQSCWGKPRPAGETLTLQFQFRAADQKYIWLELTCRNWVDPVTNFVREVHTSARDITLRKQMEYREQVRIEVLEMIAEGAPLNDILRHLTAAAERQDPQSVAAGVMLSGGITHHCAPNLPTSLSFYIERQLYHLVDRFNQLSTNTSDKIIQCDLMTDPAWEQLRAAIAENQLRSCAAILILSRHRDAAGAFSIYRRDNQRPVSATIEMMKLASELIGVAVEHRQLTDQLTFAARHDALTGLPNRAMFADRFEQVLATSARSKRPGAVVAIDVDRFKHVNDTYGHQAGDSMLCQVAQRLGKRLRQSDTLARMGGDEFAIILGELSNPADAEIVTASLIQEFATPIDLNGHEFFVTVSIGSASFPQDGANAATLQKNADLALYRAKNAGRNTARAYTSDMSEGQVECLELESALRTAVSSNQLLVHYQPIVDGSGRVIALEALVRWNHPTLGMVPPAKFLRVAEDTGLILSIDRWVLHEAGRQVRAWFEAGKTVVPISVNISTAQFNQRDFVATVAEVLAQPGMPQNWLQIDLTEAVLMRNISDAADKLTRLHDLHVGVAIDDFGTGYSSLAYLQRLTIDTLKIDHSFVRSLAADRCGGNGRVIVNTIISLGKTLGLTLIAEGVETAFQRETLRDLGCDVMQGYLFSQPQPAAMIETILRANQIALPLRLSA